jgi:hypothetical protein
MKKLALRGGGFERLREEPSVPQEENRMWVKMGEVLVLGLVDRSEEKVRISRKKHTELILFTDMLVASCFVGKKVPYQNYYQPMKILWIKEIIVVCFSGVSLFLFYWKHCAFFFRILVGIS